MRIIKIFCLLFPISISGQVDTTDRFCSYPGGIIQMQQVLKANLIYPKSAIENPISGQCYIKFTVDTLGNPTNIAVQKSLRGDCDTAAIKAIEHLRGWEPSKLKGKKVIANMSIPINFTPTSKN